MEAQGPEPALEAIRALSPRGKKPRHEVQKALDSFTAQAVRMDYPTYAEHHRLRHRQVDLSTGVEPADEGTGYAFK